MDAARHNALDGIRGYVVFDACMFATGTCLPPVANMPPLVFDACMFATGGLYFSQALMLLV
jgi:hypothetical protein